MSPADAAKVLTLIATYDNRNFDHATATVWSDALTGLEVGDCLDAVRLHFRRSKEWLMPADIRAIARTLILERRAAETPAIKAEPSDPQADQQRAGRVRELIADLGKPPAEDTPHPPVEAAIAHAAKQHACPWCKAAAGEHCTNAATGRRSQTIHQQRIDAASEASHA